METKTVIETEEEWSKLKYKEPYSYLCKNCGEETLRKKVASDKERQLKFLCRKCLFSLFPKSKEEQKAISEKRKLTNLKKYGVDNPSKSLEVLQKIQNTNIERFGVSNVMQNGDIIKKSLENRSSSSESLKRSWGERTTEEKHAIQEKIKSTLKTRYGVEHALQSDNFREKAKSTFLRNYGVDHFMLLPEYAKGVSEKRSSSLEIKKQEERKLLEEKFGKLFSVEEACEILERHNTTVYAYYSDVLIRGTYSSYIEEDKLNLLKQVERKGVSLKEKELVNFLKSLGEEVEENNKSILKGKELDVYLPGKNLAIEFNGLYWHSDIPKFSTDQIPSEEERVFARKRHLEKTLACEENGIRLIHIFEDDWDTRRPIVESILRIALGKPLKKVFARKCKVKEIDNSIYKDFLIQNHLQGYSKADLRIGLFFEGELLECCGILRKGNHTNNPELVRLCTKKNCQVIGGFSKLLKHSGFEIIDSYVDIGTFGGAGYRASGFVLEKVNPPTYFYTKGRSRIPRYFFQRKEIQKQFQQGKLKYWNSEETEETNMYKNGYGRIWNCGTAKVRFSILKSEAKK